MERLLAPGPFDVAYLEEIVNSFYAPRSEAERTQANALLSQFTEHPDSWTRVDQILERSTRLETKFLGLKILQSCIQQRWKIIPEAQRKGIKDYIVNLVITISSDATRYRESKAYVSKLNEVLIQIVKQEWPAQWPNFISEIVDSSQSNETLCENNLRVLKLLSEEVFDFSSGQMTQKRILDLKQQFNADFAKVFQLCHLIFTSSQSVTLLQVTLETLHRFLNWIPLGYIFETKLIETLVTKFLPLAQFRNTVLNCLTEIAGLELDAGQAAYAAQLQALFIGAVQQLTALIPPTADLARAYDEGSEEDSQFVHFLCLFLTTFLRTHAAIVEGQPPVLLQALDWLVRIFRVQEKEVFKMGLEYWLALAKDLFHKDLRPAAPAPSASACLGPAGHVRGALTEVRKIVISRMARPEEVLLYEDENGQVQREYSKDTDSIVLYKTMRECLIFLTHLNPHDTEEILVQKLARIVDGSEYSFTAVNTLSWSVGAIAGTMNEDDERRFVVDVVRELLGLCENRQGKDNKAVIASNIMFVVAQYPRFLRAHWRFLKTVVNKLFEFMHERFPGVQDMACDTFLKIAQKCRRKLAILQPGETMPFINEILLQLNSIISDLSPGHVLVVYEALATIVGAQVGPQRDQLVKSLFLTPNELWRGLMAQAAQSIDVLKRSEVQQQLLNILQALGQGYALQLGAIFMDALNLYKAYTQMVSEIVAAQGVRATHLLEVKQMRSVKKEILRLVEAFVTQSEDPQSVAATFLPPLMESVLPDYQASIPEARDAEVLQLFSSAITKLRTTMQELVPNMFSAVFEPTLAMITANFEDFPEHRVQFYNLLRAINQHCFATFRVISGAQFKLVIDSIIWGFKHAERNIADIALNLLLELLRNVQNSDIAQPFYQTYLIALMQDLLFVLTDTFHKPGFKMHATILLYMFRLVRFNQVTAPLFPSPEAAPGMTNEAYLRQVLADLLGRSFKNFLPAQIAHFVQGLLTIDDLTLFKNHLRDFLVQTKEFAGDTADLFLEETQAAEVAKTERQRQIDLQLPLILSRYLHVHALGEVVLKPGFHSPLYLYPVGYQVHAFFALPDGPKTEYLCQVDEGPSGKPLMRITPLQPAAEPSEAATCNQAWSQILKRHGLRSCNVDGHSLFGLHHPTVRALLFSLPRANQTVFRPPLPLPVREPASAPSGHPSRIGGVLIPRLPNGVPLLPLAVDETLVLHRLGAINPHPAFHTKAAIYPVGYKALKRAPSVSNPAQNCDYLCEIFERAAVAAAARKPLFRVTCQEEPILMQEADTPALHSHSHSHSHPKLRPPDRLASVPADHGAELTRGGADQGAWRQLRQVLVETQAQVRGTRSQTSGDWADMFGLASPVVLRLIEELPAAAACGGYLGFPSAPAAPASGTAASPPQPAAPGAAGSPPTATAAAAAPSGAGAPGSEAVPTGGRATPAKRGRGAADRKAAASPSPSTSPPSSPDRATASGRATRKRGRAPPAVPAKDKDREKEKEKEKEKKSHKKKIVAPAQAPHAPPGASHHKAARPGKGAGAESGSESGSGAGGASSSSGAEPSDGEGEGGPASSAGGSSSSEVLSSSSDSDAYCPSDAFYDELDDGCCPAQTPAGAPWSAAPSRAAEQSAFMQRIDAGLLLLGSAAGEAERLTALEALIARAQHHLTHPLLCAPPHMLPPGCFDPADMAAPAAPAAPSQPAAPAAPASPSADQPPALPAAPPTPAVTEAQAPPPPGGATPPPASARAAPMEIEAPAGPTGPATPAAAPSEGPAPSLAEAPQPAAAPALVGAASAPAPEAKQPGATPRSARSAGAVGTPQKPAAQLTGPASHTRSGGRAAAPSPAPAKGQTPGPGKEKDKDRDLEGATKRHHHHHQHHQHHPHRRCRQARGPSAQARALSAYLAEAIFHQCGEPTGPTPAPDPTLGFPREAQHSEGTCGAACPRCGRPCSRYGVLDQLAVLQAQSARALECIPAAPAAQQQQGAPGGAAAAVRVLCPSIHVGMPVRHYDQALLSLLDLTRILTDELAAQRAAIADLQRALASQRPVGPAPSPAAAPQAPQAQAPQAPQEPSGVDARHGQQQPPAAHPAPAGAAATCSSEPTRPVATRPVPGWATRPGGGPWCRQPCKATAQAMPSAHAAFGVGPRGDGSEADEPESAPIPQAIRDKAKMPSEKHKNHCHYCHRTGQLLLCDYCPRVFHLHCLRPPLSRIPTEEWACPRGLGLWKCMVSTKLQKRLAASVLKCGERRIWLDPSEAQEISMANSRLNVRKLVKDGLIIKKPVAVRSRSRTRARLEAKKGGNHTGFGKRHGTIEARLKSKILWMRRMRVLRRLLRKYREQKKLDNHLYRELYMKVKGNVFKNKRVMMEYIHSSRAKETKEKQIQDQADALRSRNKACKEKRMAKLASRISGEKVEEPAKKD
ncbi:putative Protein EXPORTIN 1A [Paratrimastix pyriformis]|uniref:Ribosomal protein L19 n=1 Tax=Paratrimastix pyriformis TaxID=342808 RepID=A0ABQ8U7J0_9EUKA|nr:putative Protein EXPORTIN 1A [Paratrimastix pyriformis]